MLIMLIYYLCNKPISLSNLSDAEIVLLRVVEDVDKIEVGERWRFVQYTRLSKTKCTRTICRCNGRYDKEMQRSMMQKQDIV
jgi:hypothetical protein